VKQITKIQTKSNTIQKLQNKNPKIYSNCREGPEQCWKVSGRGNSGGASYPSATNTAARGFTRRRRKVQQAGGSGTVSSSLLFPARGGFHRDLQRKKTHKQSVLFCFLDLSSSSAFSLLCWFSFCRWPIWWLGVLLLLLLRFRWLAVKRNDREGGVAAGPVRPPLGAVEEI